MSGDLARFVQTCVGRGEGYLFVPVGREPYRDQNGKYKHRSWIETSFRWPQQSDRLLHHITQTAPEADVYLCPYPMQERHRHEGTAAMRMIAHTDADNTVDIALVAELGGFVVWSGTPGHGHVYVPLAWHVTPEQHEALCRGLAQRFGGDHKYRDNDVLRPPDTRNYKPTLDGQPAAPVTVTWPAGQLGRVNPMTLAATLGIDWSKPQPAATTTHSRRPQAGDGRRSGGDYETTAVDLENYPDLQDALADTAVPPDRSKDTWRIAQVCRDAGLTLPQTRWVIYQREDLKQRLLDRKDDDLAAIWDKLSLTDWANRKEDATDRQPADDAPPPQHPDDPGPDEPPDLDDHHVAEWVPPPPQRDERRWLQVADFARHRGDLNRIDAAAMRAAIRALKGGA